MYHLPTMSPALLTKALLRAAEQLDLSTDLAALLQMPAEQIPQLQSGASLLNPGGQEWSRALQIVGMFRTMIEVLGNTERAKAWLGTLHESLGARPIDLLRTSDAELVHRYLSAVRKHELRMPPARRMEH